jgi:hypothetical protein
LDDIYYERILNRIIQGRLRVKVGDLVLFIYEPDSLILEESYEVYEEAKKRAYFSGCYLKEDAINLLCEMGLWSPFDKKQAEELEKKVEDLKVHLFENFFKKKEAKGIKANIRMTENLRGKILAKEHQFDHLTCEGVAGFTRKSWILSNTTKTIDGNIYNFADISSSSLLDIYSSQTITTESFRKVARSSPFRTMWSTSKTRGDVFGKCSTQMDGQQLSLVSFATMYDNVYEHPESPVEAIVDDDDALDGWFIVQKRKNEKERLAAAADAKLAGSKNANAQEVMLMATNQEDAQNIYDLNAGTARSTIQSRQKQIKETDGDLHFKDFADVKQDRAINAIQTGIQTVKGRGK